MSESKNPFQNTKWPNNTVGSSFVVSQSKEIVAYSQNSSGCTIGDTINIIIRKPANIYMPDVISLKSEINNCIASYSKRGSQLSNFEISIYDLKGIKVFTTTDPNGCWDGTMNGQYVKAGIYVYRLRYQNNDCIIAKVIVGDITKLK